MCVFVVCVVYECDYLTRVRVCMESKSDKESIISSLQLHRDRISTYACKCGCVCNINRQP